jgi:hypothetical protein
MKLTREQIENILEHYKGQPASKFAEALEVQDVRALCDAALQVEAAEKSVEYWREQTSNANKQAEAMENDMMFARCQVEAMREAIRRAVDDLDTWLFVTSNKNDRITATVRRVRDDLEQALNERKET